MKTLHKEVITKDTLALLQNISANPTFENFYLAGGTSLALQIGHLKSIDLDFFTQQEFLSNMTDNLNFEYKIISKHNNSIELTANGTKVMFFYYAYPLVRPIKVIDNIRLADPVDIGLQKLLALQGRDQKKDIVDLYFIDRNIIPLEKLLDLFEKHFPSTSFNSYDSFKTLIDKQNVLNQPKLRMLTEINFDKCFKLVSKKLAKHISKIIS